VRIVWKVALVLLTLWFGSCRAGGSSIYALEEDDALLLSNVPVDRRFMVLVEEPQAADRRSSLSPDDRASRRSLYSGIIDKAANVHGLDSALLHAVIAVESGYDPAARSRKGAGGLMQLMPGTAKRYGVVDAFDPAQNIDGGARYLRDLLQMFDKDLSLVLAAYNAGENAVIRNQNRIPRNRETIEYVPKVLAHYRQYQNAPASR